MGAEALSSLGLDDLVAPWVEWYKTRHQAMESPTRRRRIDPTNELNWRAALGDYARVEDWATLFGAELDQSAWPAVLDRWVPRLLPGYAGALTHGLLRTAHAVRALPTDGAVPPSLLEELARGLAFWAATNSVLPGPPGMQGPRRLADAIAHVPRPDPPWTVFEAGSFAGLDELDGFTAALDELGPPESSPDALSDVTSVFCDVVLAQPAALVVPLVHTVTPASSMRVLLAHMSSLAANDLYALTWNVNAAIVAGFVPPTPAEPEARQRDDADPPTPADVAARAVECGDPHAIKFAEACLREHCLRPDSVYLLAADHVITQFAGARWQ
jgi:hypothetical protein